MRTQHGLDYSCERFYTYFDVFKNWKCSQCNKPINTKINFNNRNYTCHIQKPEGLKVSELLTLDYVHIHSILNIERNGKKFRIALAEYGQLYAHENEYFVKIIGGRPV